jgi:hypothetical protein
MCIYRPDPSVIDRTVLPIPEPDYPRSTMLDARDATPLPVKRVD